MLDEIYQAAHDGQSRLMSIGVRAALDQLMTGIIGDIGSFEQKLDRMVADGFFSPRQKDMLALVIDAGSAATHRTFRPPLPLLEQMVVVMETTIRDHYITNPMLDTLRTMIPPKPPRRPGKPGSANPD